MAVQDVARIEERLDRAKAGATLISDEMGGVLFQNMAEVMEFAKLMSLADIAIPAHLRGNPGACLRIVTQALEWRMSPFSVAEQSYKVGDKIGYMAQLVHAVIEQRAPIVGRMRHRFEGEGDDRVCIVWAQVRGEADPLEYKSPPFGRIQPKNSPLWKTKPDLQQYYNTSRDFCRVYFPDVLLGVYAEEELRDSHIGPERAKDITPDIAKRLTKSKGKRGFDADHVERETKPTEPEAAGSPAPEAVVSAEASASPADANGAADTLGTPAAPQPSHGRVVVRGEVRPDGSAVIHSFDEVAEIAGATTTPVSGAEARAAGDAQGSDGGSPSRNLFQEYLDMIREGEGADPRSVKRQHDKFFTRYPLPEHPDLRAKFARIRTLRLKECNGEDVTMALREAVAS